MLNTVSSQLIMSYITVCDVYITEAESGGNMGQDNTARR